MIVFKLGFIVGLVLASPVILWQVWAFLAPALYAREKKALVPALFVGLLLFLAGAALAYVFVVPQALRVLFSFQTEAIRPIITYDAYFRFVLQVVLALGISFELPLVMIILAWLGIVLDSELNRVPPVRRGRRLRRGRGALARRRRALDDHDDGPAAPALRGRRGGRLAWCSAGGARPRRPPASLLVVLLCLAGAAGLDAQVPAAAAAAARPAAGPAGPGSRRDTGQGRRRAAARLRHAPAGSACRPRLARASRRPTRS